MQKDYKPSQKYTQDDLQHLGVAYQFRDICQDQFAQFLICKRQRPKFIQNPMVYFMPLSDYYTQCKVLKQQWTNCQDYREKELFQTLKNIYQAQKKSV